MKNKKGKVIKGIVLFLAIAVLGIAVRIIISLVTISPVKNLNIENEGAWYNKYSLVTHALGTDGEIPYNCLEGFEYSYNNGARVFECDLGETRDNHLVLSHSIAEADEEITELPDYKEFMSTLIEGKYTPMSFDMMIDEMVSHPEIYLITDFKSESSERTLSQMSMMVNQIKERGEEELYHRIIPQFYAEEELPEIKKLADFGGYIFTLYKRGLEDDLSDFEEVARFCRENGVEVIVLKRGKWCKSFARAADKYGVKVYPHTVYNLWHLERNFRSQADGCYTDGLFEKDYDYIKNLPPHWYEKAKDFVPCASVEEAQQLYNKGKRCFRVQDSPEDYIDFLAQHEDAYLNFDYNKDDFPKLAELAEKAGAAERLVAALHSEGIVDTIEPYISWCDTMYDIHEDYLVKLKKGKTPAEAFDSVLNKLEERGISVAVMEEEDWQREFYDVMKWHDCQIYIKGKGIKHLPKPLDRFEFWLH